MEANFQKRLEKKLVDISESGPEEQWVYLKSVLHEVTVETVGYSTRKHRDWFDESDPAITELLEKKRKCYNQLLKKPNDPTAKLNYRCACSALQSSFRTLQNNW